MATQKKAGPPTKDIQLKNKVERMELKLKESLIEGNQKLVDNYLTYLNVLHECATGTGSMQDASITNRASSAKVLIEKTEKLLDKANVDSVDDARDLADDKTPPAPLISLVAKQG